MFTLRAGGKIAADASTVEAKHIPEIEPEFSSGFALDALPPEDDEHGAKVLRVEFFGLRLLLSVIREIRDKVSCAPRPN